jgi:subtilisin family serine protease/pimeloyl-ACP methyl ester carboxylesterase
MAAGRRTDAVAKKKAQRKRAAVAAQPVESLVVYVHGIGHHLPKDDLKLEWDLALFGRDRGSATRMAYWSDLLHPTSATARQARSASDDLSPDAILAQAGLAPSNAAARAFTESMVRAYGFADSSQAQRSQKHVLPLPGFIREPISRAFLKQFIADTAAYFFESKKRTAIRKRLRDVLPATGHEVTLVAHSLGSVVAVEVLAKVSRLSVRKLVTIGSPLGIQEVQDFLDLPPGHVPFNIASCIEQWDNFADVLDPIALDKGLADEFSAVPTASQVTVNDQIIVNGRTRRLRGFNPHSAAGYLSHPKVRRSVYEATHFDTLTRFVVARDVAEALGRDERHPVLIEVLEPGYPAVGEDPATCAARERTAPTSLAARVARMASDLETLVRDAARDAGASPAAQVKAAQIDELRRFVAAHLNADELRLVAERHRDFNVYAVWSSAAKRKLIDRSRGVLQADAALESYQATGARIRWAVLDTGVRSTHPHFIDAGTGESRVTAVWDCTQRGKPQNILGTPREDRDGHGSHVAGIIAGKASHDGRTYSGIAPEASLVVYKVLDDRGDGEDAWIIKALDHIAGQNENNPTTAIHGLNLSLGGPYDATVYGCGFTPICQELRRLWRSGVLVVVACGNEGQLEVQTRDGDVEINTPMSIGDPANLEDCIAVGSVNADRPHLYGISAFSSRGPTSDGRCKPDVVAPGERIRSVNARFRGNRSLYRVDSGTSMAAPHVSGLLAAFLSVRREFIGRPDEVKKILLDNCTDIGRERQHQGRGIPNLMKMLLSV